MRYNSGTGESILWVNPTSESSSSITANDTPSTATIGGVALRQPGNAIGDLIIGHMKVGTSFSDVFSPSAESLQYQVIGTDFVLTWVSPLFHISTATSVLGPFTTISNSTSPYTNPIAGPAKFFR